MHEIELRVSNTTIKLMCEDEKKLIMLTDLLDKKITDLKKQSHISDLKAFFITSLYLLDELESLKNEVQVLKASFYDKFESEKEKVGKNYKVIVDEIKSITKMLDKK